MNMEFPPMTGVVRPLSPGVYDSSQGVPLGAGWIVLFIVGLIIIAIILRKKFLKKRTIATDVNYENVETDLEEIRPIIVKAIKKGYSKEKIKRRIKKALN